ncbi:MAG: hypothetical protein EB075_13790, partial [Bacteroidetes bacterium]|nr:hypothetical protein [Bacteroidota bacterium]
IGLSDTLDGGRVYIAGVAPYSAVDDFIQAPNANVYIDFVSYGNAGNNHLNFAARGISSKNITLSGSAQNNLLLGRKLGDTAGLSLGDIRRLHASDTLTITTRNTSESDYGWLILDLENGIPFTLAAGDLLGNLVLKNSKISGFSGTSIALSSGKTLTLDTMNTAGDGFYTTISGDTKLVKRGVGTLVLNAANTYTGGTSIQEGILQVGYDNSGGTLGQTSGALEIIDPDQTGSRGALSPAIQARASESDSRLPTYRVVSGA